MEENKNHQVIAMIPDNLFKQFKHLSVESNKTMRDLLIEAIKDILIKYHE